MSTLNADPFTDLSQRAVDWFESILNPLPAQAQVEQTETFSFAPLGSPLTPPDGSPVGIQDTRPLTSGITSINDVNLWITLDNPVAGGAYNGDLYVTLTHDSGFAVLMNRVGRRDGDSIDAQFGYGDNGFQITLDDQAPNGDVHAYRLRPPGLSHDTPVDPNYQAALRGTWAPDGRNVSPNEVLLSDLRTHTLANFNGLSAAGQWRLFVADLSSGGTVTLKDWGLQIRGLTAIPEPSHFATGIGIALVLAAVARRHTHRLRRRG